MIRILAAIACLTATLALAQTVPTSISFNARLADTAGAPITGAHALSFGLFDQASGGAAVWTENVAGASFSTDGLAYVELGAVTPLTPAALDGRKLFLEVGVDGTPMAPRLAIISVPYALRASVAATAGSVGSLTEAAIQRRVTGTCAPGQSVRSIDASGGVQCENLATGDITAVTTATGSGLTGGAMSGDVALSLAACATGEVLKSGGTSWACAADAVGPTYGVTAPLSLSGTTLSLSGCPNNQVLRSNGTTFVCAADVSAVTTATGSGLTGGGSAGSLALALTPCATGQVLKFGATGWACAASDTGASLVLSEKRADVTLAAGGYTVVGSGRADGYVTLPNSINASSHVAGAAVVGSKVYVVGGYNPGGTGGNCVPNNQEYDLVTQAWTAKQQMNIPRYGHAVIGFNGKVYAIGGYCTAGNLANEIYDPATNGWTLGAALSGNNHYSPAAAVLSDGKLHVVGGYNHITTNAVSAEHHVYDFSTNSWSTAAPMPGARYYVASGVLSDGRMIVAGGYDGTGPRAEVYAFDLNSGTWATLASLPAPTYLLAGATLGGKFHTFMGYTTAVNNFHYIYEPSNNTWTTGIPVPYAAAYAPQVAQLRGSALIISGWNGPNITNAVEYLAPLYLYGR